MTYDNWKCTDPNDQWLGEEPMDDEEMAAMHKRYEEMTITLENGHRRFRDGELTLSGLGEVYEDCGYHPYQIRQLLSRHAQYLIPKGYFGRE